eukprot:8885076-Pyramimonas_sp.AAC.1
MCLANSKTRNACIKLAKRQRAMPTSPAQARAMPLSGASVFSLKAWRKGSMDNAKRRPEPGHPWIIPL